MSAPSDPDARPSKRARLSPSTEPSSATATQATTPAASQAPAASSAPTPTTADDDLERESRAGITEYVSPNNRGFSGVLKKRYVDFLVNEIGKDGVVVHLKDTSVKHKEKAAGIGAENGKNAGQAKSGNFGDAKPKDTQQEKFTLKFEDEGDAVETAAKPEQKKPAPSFKLIEEPEPDAEMKDADVKPAETAAAKEEAKEGGEDQISTEDLATLHSIFGQQATSELLKLVRQIRKRVDMKAKNFNAVIAPPIADKDTRTQAHQCLRRIFPNMLESSMEPDQSIRIKALPPQERGSGNRRGQNGRGGRDGADPDPQRQRGTLAWEERGGEYLHFTMYKENKDTMEVIGFLGSKLKTGTKPFSFAGTKDRRACTVQRVCIKRQTAEKMSGLNKVLFNAALGDFEYKRRDLNLGDLLGNEFVITLRDAHFEGEEGLDHAQRVQLANEIVAKSINDFSENGFINYYGLQRFGSFSASTDRVGLRMLQGDFKGAVDDLLAYTDIALEAADKNEDNVLVSKDDKLRAKGLHIWRTTGKGQAALDKIPKKFSAERNIIQHLSSKNSRSGLYDRKNDYQGALGCVPRALRLMYVHAYQSLVWNMAAGHRWSMYGDKVVVGDLVLVNEHKDKVAGPEAIKREGVDENGEMVINPVGEDSAIKDEEMFERARPLTEEEARSGQYSISDVVLPQPGFDVEYPKNATGAFYQTFMASERGGGLDPYNMRRPWKEVSLSGGYRKFLSKPLKPMEYEIKEYERDDEPLVETDLQRLEKEKGCKVNGDADRPPMAPTEGQEGKKIAVVLKMQLASSQYATIALRELMKAGGVKAFKPEYFSGAR
ncbi:pseudouridine synthase-like protein TruD/Pus7 [Corynespora cassiicola Philippines]|uniref:Pseudouridine synthase-like protein TruD/Pus7 n=1 Tax=Corynespora cassiicola Philippines TaxID=1448308 RepID=A0A2T2PA80_CORCC|nr:pseudouridine synthase-like protein TruD/Pus7 [Corynespora cassiicola Philippines]